MKQGSGDKSEKVLRSKRAKHVQRDRALNQFLLAGIPDPLFNGLVDLVCDFCQKYQ